MLLVFPSVCCFYANQDAPIWWQRPHALWDKDLMCSWNFKEVSTKMLRSQNELRTGSWLPFRTYIGMDVAILELHGSLRTAHLLAFNCRPHS